MSNSEKLSTKIFYHSADLDGHCSGAIVLKAQESYLHSGRITSMHGIDYGEEFPWGDISLTDHVVVVDFCLEPFSSMVKLKNKCKKLTWIDHHASAIADEKKEKELGGFECEGIRDTNFAACELAWRYFFPNYPLPLPVFLIGRYDIWKWQDVEDALDFQIGMKIRHTRPDDHRENGIWGNLFQCHSSHNTFMSRVIDDGRIISKYEKIQNKIYADKFAFDAVFDGHNIIALNRGMCGSRILDGIYDEKKHDFMCLFCKDKTGWRLSFYTEKAGIDVSVIAKKYGGGGHVGAAGCEVSELPFKNPQKGKEEGAKV